MRSLSLTAARGEHPGAIDTNLWMVPYADLMTVMVILFLALFAYSYSMRTPEYERALRRLESEMASRAEAPEADLKLREAELAVDARKLLEGLALKDFGVRVSERYIHFSLPTPVLFATGSAALTPDSARVLKPLAALLSRTANPVLVSGHTDDRPIVGGPYATNWELSAARAFSVIRHLSELGLAPERFSARGYGEHRPAGSNATEEGRARNRRIELSIVRELRRES